VRNQRWKIFSANSESRIVIYKSASKADTVIYIYFFLQHSTENRIQRKIIISSSEKENNNETFSPIYGVVRVYYYTTFRVRRKNLPPLITHTSPFLDLTFDVFAEPFQQVCEYAHCESSQCAYSQTC
jgi:hypothetical protein